MRQATRLPKVFKSRRKVYEMVLAQRECRLCRWPRFFLKWNFKQSYGLRCGRMIALLRICKKTAGLVDDTPHVRA